ncbi:DeoR family transcriptional regulator, partial [Candidatus Dojkabacteria bacterium]|nr:DeoR family transcriptional regulator [Candidatus Dojkabacteria bacterium]
PWKIGNNITSLLIYDYLFKKYKLDSGGLVTSLGLIDEYEDDLVRTYQYVALNQDKLDLWVKKLISLNTRYIREKRLEIDGKVEEMKKIGSERSNLLDLNKRQLKILRYLQNVPQVKREDYVHMMNVSTMTAYRDLQGLVDKDLLKVYGKGRGTKYSLVNK